MQLIAVILCFVASGLSMVPFHQSQHHRTRHQHHIRCKRSHCERENGPPICNKWCVVPNGENPFEEPKYHCCNYREKPGRCPQTEQGCKWPAPFYLKREYQCGHDFTCPTGFKCCTDPCYVHKVCKQLEFNNHLPPAKVKESPDRFSPKKQMQSKLQNPITNNANTRQLNPKIEGANKLDKLQSDKFRQFMETQRTSQREVTTTTRFSNLVTDADAGRPEAEILSPMQAHTKENALTKLCNVTATTRKTSTTRSTTEGIPTEPSTATTLEVEYDEEEEIIKDLPLNYTQHF